MSHSNRVRNRRNRVPSRRHQHSTGDSETNWREMADRGLEIVMCVGHIFGVIMLIAEHLL